MVSIPAGSFQMGSTAEQPIHQVTINSFFLGKYPVTQAQWKAVAALSKIKLDLDSDPANFKGDSRPVEQVSWREAIEFCDRLSHKTNRIYRLPSEAEWEYACRACTNTLYHFGEMITNDLANYNGGVGGTTPVGSFGVANSFGLYDMHGNVWEWCLDRWHSNYEGAPNNGSAWLTDKNKVDRSLRGGSCHYSSWYCRSASRNRDHPIKKYHSTGFRVVCSSARNS